MAGMVGVEQIRPMSREEEAPGESLIVGNLLGRGPVHVHREQGEQQDDGNAAIHEFLQAEWDQRRRYCIMRLCVTRRSR